MVQRMPGGRGRLIDGPRREQRPFLVAGSKRLTQIKSSRSNVEVAAVETRTTIDNAERRTITIGRMLRGVEAPLSGTWTYPGFPLRLEPKAAPVGRAKLSAQARVLR